MRALIRECGGPMPDAWICLRELICSRGPVRVHTYARANLVEREFARVEGGGGRIIGYIQAYYYHP